jgi:hypothetical protein
VALVRVESDGVIIEAERRFVSVEGRLACSYQPNLITRIRLANHTTLHLSHASQLAVFTFISLNRCILTSRGKKPFDF